jgi:hypothetical protein
VLVVSVAAVRLLVLVLCVVILVLVSDVLNRGELLAREKALTFAAFSRRRRDDERRPVATIVVNFIVACLCS